MAHLGELIAGRLVRRDNRFRATVIVDGKSEAAHVPNSGRMRELLTPDAVVYLRPAHRAGRVTSYDLLLVEHEGHPVCIDARWPPRLIREAWERGDLAAVRGLRLGQAGSSVRKQPARSLFRFGGWELSAGWRRSR